MKKEQAIYLFIRYGILVALGFGLEMIYKIFTSLTVYPVYWILNSLYGGVLADNNTILLKGIFIELIPACIAGSAYYLLLILNLSTSMDIGKRLKNITYLIFSFLLLNIFRILVMIWIFFALYDYFNLTHRVVWYIGSTIMVVVIWFFGVYIFNIKEIPIYSDIKNIIKDIKKR